MTFRSIQEELEYYKKRYQQTNQDLILAKQEICDLQSNQQGFHSFFMHSADAMMVVDLTCRIVQVNHAFEKIFGWSIHEITDRIPPNVPSNLREESFSLIEQVKTGSFITNYETLRARKDGSLLNVSITLSPIRNNHGDIVGIACVTRDITEKINAEEELRMTIAHLESFINNTADAIGVFDLDGTILSLNKASEEIFGYTLDEMIGYKVKTIPDDSYIKEVEWLQQTVRNGEHIKGYETIRKRKDGKLLHVSITYSPIKDAEGNVIALANILRDITEKKREKLYGYHAFRVRSH